jgi:hypothetical protein
MSVDIRKKNLATAVIAFQQGRLYENGLKLFEALGYNTSRTLPLDNPSYKEFNETYDAEKEGFNQKKAYVEEWKKIQLLFQLTSEEMIEQLPAFKPTVNRDEPASFLFFTIELTAEEYSRSKLADIAREVNKPFKMDVFVLFKYGNYITLSLIERRPNKKIYNRDVIEKVTHVYNINIPKPHAGHIHILESFSFENLAAETKRKRIEGFKDLQTAWKKAVSTQLLNKQFYTDYSRLSRKLIQAIHPDQIKNKLAAHQGVLNLLNRIMFIYFVQKKDWIMKDGEFINNFWLSYLQEGHEGKNLFHKHWLNTVFFFAFNNRLWESKSLKHIPEEL